MSAIEDAQGLDEPELKEMGGQVYLDAEKVKESNRARFSGIGRAIAIGYAREGAQVVLLDVNAKSVEAVAQEIRDSGGAAESFALDVTKRGDCDAVAKRIAEQVGAVTILVNNAGIARRNGMLGAAEAVISDWEDIIAINLTGVFNVTHAFLSVLRAGKGRIVNIGSIQSFMHVRTPSLAGRHWPPSTAPARPQFGRFAAELARTACAPYPPSARASSKRR